MIARYRKRYGPTWTEHFPGWPPTVVTSDREAIRTVFTGDPLRRRHASEPLAPLIGHHSLLMLEPADHLARRRLELAPFHGKRVQAYADRIRELVSAEVGAWPADTVMAVHPRAQALTLAVILELVLGVRDEDLQNRLASTFESIMTPRLNNLSMFLPRWIATETRWNVLTAHAWSRVHRLDRLIHEQIAATRADPHLQSRDDVLALLLLARDDEGKALTDAELRDELVTLLGAGHETTATAIGWSADLLAHNPGVAARLRQTLARGERDYLKATVKEVLRIRTVAPISAQRRVLEPFQIDGYAIGPDVAVAIDADGLHHNPALYPEPDAFRPERFLDNPPDGYAYLPFGGGAHRCLGAALAMLELELAIEAIATRWVLEPVGPPARPVRRGPTWSPDNRGRVRIERVRELAEPAAAPALA
jgi:cytochrome P450